jgi:hypothetical protein
MTRSEFAEFVERTLEEVLSVRRGAHSLTKTKSWRKQYDSWAFLLWLTIETGNWSPYYSALVRTFALDLNDWYEAQQSGQTLEAKDSGKRIA